MGPVNPAAPPDARRSSTARPAPARPAERPVPAAGKPPSVGSAVSTIAKRTLTSAVLEKRPYLKFAFANPYNLSLFLGMLAAAGLTLNPALAIAAVGLEALWLLYAPDSKRLKHLLWDPRFEEVRTAMLERERADRMQLLADEERDRVTALVVRQKEIRRLAGLNPSFTGELLRAELVKTDRLVDAFLDMAVTCRRYEDYLASVDLDALDRERTRWEVNAQMDDQDETHRAVARKNFAIILKRLEKMQEIQRYLTVARAQLDLIDNSFQLIADQIVTMQSPQQLSGQLDELLDGVESIRQTAVDTDRILGSMGIGSAV
jgi:hypothetical protein